jgi:hypothetical protein
MEKTKVGGQFGSERTSQRSKVKKAESYVTMVGYVVVGWPCEAYFDTMRSPTWIFPEYEACPKKREGMKA